MLKKTISLGVGLALAGSIASTAAYASGCNYTLDYVKKNVPYKTQGVKIVKQTKVDNDLCNIILKIKTPMGERYISTFAVKSNKSLIVGSMFKDKQPFSFRYIMGIKSAKFRKKFDKYYPLHKQDFNDSIMASYKPKNFKHKIAYVFIDPLCPFCKKIEPGLKKLADETGYEIALVPLIIHGEKAANDVRNFICSKGSFDDYLNGKFGKSQDCKRATKIMKTAWNIEKDLKIMGTPTIITSDGKIALGADAHLIKEVLTNGSGIKKGGSK